jgi:hypothetical protein
MNHSLRARQILSGITTPNRLLLGLIFVSFVLVGPMLGAAAALGDSSGDAEAVVKLVVVESSKEADEPSSEAGAKPDGEQEPIGDELKSEMTRQVTKLAADRLRDRLKAAEIKRFSVTSDEPRTIVVRARGGVSRELLAGIVAPAGRFELRPVLSVGEGWVKAMRELPGGVKLRQEEGSVDPDDAYLWSADRAKLHATATRAAQRYLERESLDENAIEVATYPAAGGWRTLALGSAVATQADVAHAAIRQGKTGETYVRLLFKRELSGHGLSNAGAEHSILGASRTWAIVLDGEVVSVMDRAANSLGNSLSVMAPEHLRTRDARRIWAQQVAGRLAAYMPITLMEVRAAPDSK